MISFIIGSAKPVLSVIGRLLGAVDRWLRSRRDYRSLCDMSERDLRDLGLRDSDLRDATAAPFFADPTAIISLRAEQRRGLAGGESIDQALYGLSAEATAQPQRVATEAASLTSSRAVLLQAAE